MAWLRTESNFPNHRKVLAAGQQLGKGAIGRVIGIWTIGACYAVGHLTDGLVPAIILEDTRYDRRPTDVIRAMVDQGLLHAEPGGYRLHDFHDYNPSAAAVKEKRRADLERKRNGHKESPQNPSGFPVNSARNPLRIFPESEKILEVPNPNPNPKKKEQDQEQSAGADASHFPVLVKLAHTVLDELNPDADRPPISELGERLKGRAARFGIPYANGRELTQALDSAVAQRQWRAS